MPRRTILDRIRRLDPEKDYRRIVLLDSLYEFPWDTVRALEMAFFRTFAIPSIGRLLGQTGEFDHATQKRRDDTDLILSEIQEHGYDSPHGRAAFRQMNRQHGRFPIANDDFLYVMATFIFEPIHWNARFGWRPMVRQEKLAAYYHWRRMGHYMHIHDIPESYEAFERFKEDFERDHFGYTAEGQRVAIATREMFLGWFLPPPLRFLGRPAIHALIEDPLREALRLPAPPPGLRAILEAGLRARAGALRFFLERRRPATRTQMRFRTYPGGYRIPDLGPAWLHQHPAPAVTGE